MMGHLTPSIQYFFTNFIILGAAAFISFYIVRDSLNAVKWKIYLGTLIFTLAYTTLSTLFASFFITSSSTFVEILFYTHPVVAVVGGAALYFKFVDEPRGKLTFMLLLVAHSAFFCYDAANSTYWTPAAQSDGSAPVIALLITFVLFYPLFARILRRLWLNIRSMENAGWFRFCLLPVMFISLSFFTRNVFSFRTDVLYLYSTVVLVVDICALVTYYTLISALTRTQEKARVEAELRGLNDTLSLQAIRMDEMTAHIEEVKLLRHDIRHHLLTLTEMLEGGRETEALAYLTEVRRDIPVRITLPLCKNYVADAIVSRYLAAAGQQGIAASAALSITKDPGIGHSDLGIVLGNLMENALEACEQQTEGEKYIRVEANMVDGRMMIEVENSAGGTAKKDGDRFLSSKREGVGLGLRSVSVIAKKYGGLAQFENKETMFRAMVLLYPDAASLSAGQSESSSSKCVSAGERI